MKNKSTDFGLLILRLTLGILMLLHGMAKISNGIEGIKEKMPNWLEFFGYGVYLGEVVAPILMIIGYRTRLASLVFAFTMVVAVGLVHSGDIFSLGKSGGWALELNGLYFFGAIALCFTGGGKFSLSASNKWD